MAWRSGVLVALGLGAALVSGGGIAHADSSGTGSAPNRSSESTHSVGHSRSTTARTAKKPPRVAVTPQLGTMRPTPPTPSEPAPGPVMVAALALARRDQGTSLAGPAPRPPAQAPPVPAFVAAATKWFGELQDFLAGAPEAHPTPGDMTSTPYGDIGKWMLAPTGGLADWPSQQYPFKTLYQPINVIIVDPTSTTAEESAQKLNAVLAAAGFPAQPIHSSGFQGVIDGDVYGQQPAGTLEAFANAHWLLTNDHGRVFGPAPGPAGTGYVWTASFSRESTGLFYVVPTHVYVSFDRARDAVRDGLVSSGATDLGLVDLDNELGGRTTTTGDHDGYAVVVRLN
jgi:hypothetical protein